jgi:hypothetical protein
MREAGQNAVANQLMNEYFPQPKRAQAVDPSLQGAADIAAQKIPGFYQGGKDELSMRMAMMDQMNQNQSRQMQNVLAAQRFGLGQQRAGLNEQESILNNQRIAERAAKASAAQTEKARDTFNDVRAYNANIDAVMAEITEANKNGDKARYDTAVSAARDLFQSADTAGLKIAQPQIAPFMTKEMKDALDQQSLVIERKVKEAAAAKERADAFGPNPDTLYKNSMWDLPAAAQKEADAAQASLEEERNVLIGMPGYQGGTSTVSQTPQSTAPAKGGGNAAPDGTVIDVGGKKMMKKGGAWVLVQ